MSHFKGKAAIALALLFSTAVLAGAATDENEAEAGQKAPAQAGAAGVAEGEYKRTIENLYYACDAEKAAATSWCSAYLMGAADTMSAFSNHKAGLCGATYEIEDLGPIFMEWARAHQELKDLDMLAGVSLAFREQWPCT